MLTENDHVDDGDHSDWPRGPKLWLIDGQRFVWWNQLQ